MAIEAVSQLCFLAGSLRNSCVLTILIANLVCLPFNRGMTTPKKGDFEAWLPAWSLGPLEIALQLSRDICYHQGVYIPNSLLPGALSQELEIQKYSIVPHSVGENPA